MIQCFPGQLNQVFMNLLANAIDALDESNKGRSFDEIKNNPNQITVTTKICNDQKQVVVSIKDKKKTYALYMIQSQACHCNSTECKF
ncbi:MAG: hypothetical protein KME29_28075 [Calothrix sp. FI2-JRJ7]|nr:hypothetical protein [Calothrix sp. FI2-JRJ7]